MTTETARKLEIAIASRLPVTLADIIQAIPIALDIFDNVFGMSKYKKKNIQLMLLIENLTDSTPIHMVKDTAKLINES